VDTDSRITEAIAAFRRGELERARALAEAQIEGAQGPPDAHHLLGLIDCREGRADAGVSHLRLALTARPDNAAFRVMLARALVDAARPREALEIAVAPAATTPEAIALWHVRAEAALASGEAATAVEAWSILCAARPDDWRSWANCGNALASLERWEEAANALRRAWTLNPNERSILGKLATALTKAGFYAEAADQLRRLLELGADDIGARLTLARLLADLGRNEEAVEQLGKAASTAVGTSVPVDGSEGLIRIAIGDHQEPGGIGPAQLRAVRELAMLLERTNQTGGLRALLADARRLGIAEHELAYPAAAVALRDGDPAEAKRLLALEDPEADPVGRHALMAKAADRLGDSATAFAAAEAMHSAIADRDDWRRKAANYRRQLRAMTAAFTPEWSARLPSLPAGARPSPAFLVGFPRSGTTLLDTFLMGHPDVQVIEERQMLGAAGTVVGSLTDLPSRSVADLERARAAYFAELDRYLVPGGGPLAIDKLPLNMLGLVLIRTLFPDARVVFAQRHPCDVVLSGFMQSFVMNDAMACFLDLADAADLYDTALDLWSQSRTLMPDGILTSVYEQLVTDPEASLRPLVAFLGLDWQPELLDHRSTAAARGAISTPSYDQVIQPLNKAPSGRWRRYAQQLAPVLPVLLPWAERLGYAD